MYTTPAFSRQGPKQRCARKAGRNERRPVDARFIADACALIAYLSDAPLSEAADAAIQSPELVSSITVWELTRKAAIGKLPAYWRPGGLARFLADEGFIPLPLTWADAERAMPCRPSIRTRWTAC